MLEFDRRRTCGIIDHGGVKQETLGAHIRDAGGFIAGVSLKSVVIPPKMAGRNRNASRI